MFVATKAQQEQELLKIGSPIPNFNFSEVFYYPKAKVGLSDFKGKWLILDIWSRTCTVCIEGFPKLNKLQQEFAGQLNVLLVGMNDQRYNKDIKNLFDRIKIRQKLSLPIAYDSVFVKRFVLPGVPYVLVIDPKGIIRAIPKHGELTADLLDGLINPQKSGLVKIDSLRKKEPFFYSSELSNWHKGIPPIRNQDIEMGLSNGKYSSKIMRLEDLYLVAYFGRTRWILTDSLYGKAYRKPILEVKDPGLFVSNFNNEYGFYNYSLVVPPQRANKEYLQFAMQSDLMKYFGYKVVLEERDMPCWLLKVSGNAARKLKSKALVSSRKRDHAGFKYVKVPITDIIKSIWSYHQNGDPILDESGISGDIDLAIEADLTNLEDVRAVLAQQGVDLVKGTRKMKVIVIRD